jgi:hypothetical protein
MRKFSTISIALAAGLSLVALNAAADAVLMPRGTQLVAMDPQSGWTRVVATLPVSGIAGGTSSFDPATDRFFFLGSNGAQAFLVSVLAATGATSTVPLSVMGFTEYDPTTQSVLAADDSTIFSVNPTSGAITPIATLPSAGFAGGTVTYDPVGRRLFYITSTGTVASLVTVALNTGTVTRVAAPLDAIFAEYDPQSGSVLVPQGLTLVAIDPVTGATRTIGPLPTTGIAGGTSSYDPAGRRLFYGGFVGSQFSLVTIAIASGTNHSVAASTDAIFTVYDPDGPAIPAIDVFGFALLACAIGLLAWIRLAR